MFDIFDGQRNQTVVPVAVVNLLVAAIDISRVYVIPVTRFR